MMNPLLSLLSGVMLGAMTVLLFAYGLLVRKALTSENREAMIQRVYWFRLRHDQLWPNETAESRIMFRSAVVCAVSGGLYLLLRLMNLHQY